MATPEKRHNIGQPVHHREESEQTGSPFSLPDTSAIRGPRQPSKPECRGYFCQCQVVRAEVPEERCNQQGNAHIRHHGPFPLGLESGQQLHTNVRESLMASKH